MWGSFALEQCFHNLRETSAEIRPCRDAADDGTLLFVGIGLSDIQAHNFFLQRYVGVRRRRSSAATRNLWDGQSAGSFAGHALIPAQKATERSSKITCP